MKGLPERIVEHVLAFVLILEGMQKSLCLFKSKFIVFQLHSETHTHTKYKFSWVFGDIGRYPRPRSL